MLCSCFDEKHEGEMAHTPMINWRPHCTFGNPQSM
jgi:hypothetical protein